MRKKRCLSILICSVLLGGLLLEGCTFTSMVRTPEDIMITSGSLEKEYEVVGIVRATRLSMFNLSFLGFIPTMVIDPNFYNNDVEDVLEFQLAEEARFQNADAVIGVNLTTLSFPWLIPGFPILWANFILVEGTAVRVK